MLPFQVVYASSEEERFSAKDLTRLDATTPGTIYGQGWRSGKNIKYPQEIGLFLQKRTRLSSLRITQHPQFVSRKATPGPAASTNLDELSRYFAARFESTDAMVFASESKRKSHSKRLKLHTDALFIKLLFQPPLLSSSHSNPFNQIGVLAIELEGASLPVSNNTSLSRAIHRPTYEFDNATSFTELEVGLLSAGVPLDLVTDSCQIAAVDKVTKLALETLEHQKLQASVHDNFSQAQQIQQDIVKLTNLGRQILNLELQAQGLVHSEHYGDASICKKELLPLRSERNQLISAALAGIRSQAAQVVNVDDEFISDFVMERTSVEDVAGKDMTYTIGGRQVSRVKFLSTRVPNEGPFDHLIKQWLLDEDDQTLLVAPELVSFQYHQYARIVDAFGEFFTRALLSSAWRVRVASIEIGEQYALTLCDCFDTEVLHAAYYDVLKIGLQDQVNNVYYSSLHLVQSVFQTSSESPTLNIHLVRAKTLLRGLDIVMKALVARCTSTHDRVQQATMQTIDFLFAQEDVYPFLFSCYLTNSTSNEFRLRLGRVLIFDYILTHEAQFTHILQADKERQASTSLTKLITFLVHEIQVGGEDQVINLCLKMMEKLINKVENTRLQEILSTDEIKRMHQLLGMERKNVVCLQSCHKAQEQHLSLFHRFPIPEAKQNELMKLALTRISQPKEIKADNLESKVLGDQDQAELMQGTIKFKGSLSDRIIPATPPKTFPPKTSGPLDFSTFLTDEQVQTNVEQPLDFEGAQANFVGTYMSRDVAEKHEKEPELKIHPPKFDKNLFDRNAIQEGKEIKIKQDTVQFTGVFADRGSRNPKFDAYHVKGLEKKIEKQPRQPAQVSTPKVKDVEKVSSPPVKATEREEKELKPREAPAPKATSVMEKEPPQEKKKKRGFFSRKKK